MKQCTDKEYELKVFEHEGKHYILSDTNMWVCDGKIMEEVPPYVPVVDVETAKENLIHELRKETGCGMMDCKKALVQSDWDYNQARVNVIVNKSESKLVD